MSMKYAIKQKFWTFVINHNKTLIRNLVKNETKII